MEKRFVIFAKEMKKLMEFQKYIEIHQNFDKTNILINYFEELYTHIENLDKVEDIKNILLNKIISNTEFLSNENTFDIEYSLVIDVFNLIINFENNNIENNNIENKLSKKLNKIRLD
jgi:hypothetical protein